MMSPTTTTTTIIATRFNTLLKLIRNIIGASMDKKKGQ